MYRSAQQPYVPSPRTRTQASIGPGMAAAPSFRACSSNHASGPWRWRKIPGGWRRTSPFCDLRHPPVAGKKCRWLQCWQRRCSLRSVERGRGTRCLVSYGLVIWEMGIWRVPQQRTNVRGDASKDDLAFVLSSYRGPEVWIVPRVDLTIAFDQWSVGVHVGDLFG